MNLLDLGVKNLCDNCQFSFADCDSGSVLFGKDLDEHVSEFEAYMVIQCDSYKTLE